MPGHLLGVLECAAVLEIVGDARSPKRVAADGSLDSGVSRLRPVAMAALTTALGMIPLLVDAFFVAMAVTIIAGLVAATVLTMLVLPVFYSVLFRVKYDPSRLA